MYKISKELKDSIFAYIINSTSSFKTGQTHALLKEIDGLKEIEAKEEESK